MAEPQKPIRTSLFFYVPVAVAGILLVAWVFLSNYRKGEEVAKITPPPAEGTRRAAPTVNHRALAKDMGLATSGKTLFQINCASCHGSDGRGDGDRAASLNPKPRNFHNEQFKFGSDIVAIRNTLLKGSPGTSMPSFALLPPEDVWALAHFVQTQIPNAPPITDELVAQLPEGGEAGGTATAGQPAVNPMDTLLQGSGPRIPILFAMERLEHESPRASTASKPMDMNHPGAAIYLNRCASCHGSQGEGMQANVVSVAPYRYVNTSGTLQNKSALWQSNRNEFGQMVVKGLPGKLMPGNATLTKQQIDDLFEYVHTFADNRLKSAQRTTP